MARESVQRKENVSGKIDNKRVRTTSMMKLSLNPDVL